MPHFFKIENGRFEAVMSEERERRKGKGREGKGSWGGERGELEGRESASRYCDSIFYYSLLLLSFLESEPILVGGGS